MGEPKVMWAVRWTDGDWLTKTGAGSDKENRVLFDRCEAYRLAGMSESRRVVKVTIKHKVKPHQNDGRTLGEMVRRCLPAIWYPDDWSRLTPSEQRCWERCAEQFLEELHRRGLK